MTFVLYPRNYPVVLEGQAWRGEANWFQTLIVILFFGIMFVAVINALGSDFNQFVDKPALLQKSGVETTAQIVNARSEHIPGGYNGRIRIPDRTLYYAIYEFTLLENRRKYSGEYQITAQGFIRITQALFHSEKMRTIPVQIVYSPANPAVSLPRQLAYADPQSAASSILCFTLPLLIFFGLVLIGTIYVTWHQLQLTHSGYLITGKIVSAGWTTLGKKTAIEIHYTFAAPDGTVFNRKQTIVRPDVVTLPAPDTPVSVLYAGNRCFEVM